MNRFESLYKLLNYSSDIICLIDQRGKFITLNTALIQICGYKPDELISQYFTSYITPKDCLKSQAIARKLMAGTNSVNFEVDCRCKNGQLKTILWTVEWDSSEHVFYCIGKSKQRKNRPNVLFNVQDNQRQPVNEPFPLAYWELDIASQTLTCSSELFQIYGLAAPPDLQWSVVDFLSFVTPVDRCKIQLGLTGPNFNEHMSYEHRATKTTGETIYLRHYTQTIRDNNGKAIALQGASKDITSLKMYQEQLEASEKRLSDILESIGDGFFTIDQDFTITYWNKIAEQLLAKKREQVIGKNLWQEFPEATSLKFESEILWAMRKGVKVHFEEFLPSSALWLDVNAYPSGEGLSIYFKDISTRKEQELKLKITNERFEFVSKATFEAIWDWDISSNTNYFNDSFTTLFGHSNASQSIQDSWSEHIHPSDKKRILGSIQAALDNTAVNKWTGEYRFFKANGSVAIVFDRGAIIRDEAGKAVRMVGSMQDVTKLKETEKAVIRAIVDTQEKERSEIGKELHDNVNQVLTTIKLYIENIRDFPEHSSVFIENGVKLAQRAINEVRFLAKQLATPVMADLGLEATIAEMVDHFKILNLFDIQLHYKVNENKLEKGMQLTIYRIIQEQLNNVVKYAKASTVTVVVKQSRKKIKIEVKDDGIGFDTTRTTHGLGLNNIRHRSELHNGKMRLLSSIGKGCTVIAEFPLIDKI